MRIFEHVDECNERLTVEERPGQAAAFCIDLDDEDAVAVFVGASDLRRLYESLGSVVEPKGGESGASVPAPAVPMEGEPGPGVQLGPARASMERTVAPWTMMPCDECGIDYQATRAEPRTKARFFCGECDALERAGSLPSNARWDGEGDPPHADDVITTGAALRDLQGAHDVWRARALRAESARDAAHVRIREMNGSDWLPPNASDTHATDPHAIKRRLEGEAAALLRALSHSHEVKMSWPAQREVLDWAKRWDDARSASETGPIGQASLAGYPEPWEGEQ